MLRLGSLDLASFNTNKVRDISHMFDSYSTLTGIKRINKFGTQLVNDMEGMLNYCQKLATIFKIFRFI